MANYKLKANQPDFEVVDGPLAGRKFQAGQVYAEIPEVEKVRFEEVPDQTAQAVGSADLKEKTKQARKGEVENGS